MKTKKTFWYMTREGAKCVTKGKVDKICSTTPMVYGELAHLIYDHIGQIRGFKDGMSKKITVTIES